MGKMKNLRKWQLKKALMELLSIIIIIIGAIMTLLNWFDVCPVWSLMGVFIIMVGIAIFIAIRDNYKYSSKKVR